jgi:hypothetical protein
LQLLDPVKLLMALDAMCIRFRPLKAISEGSMRERLPRVE